MALIRKTISVLTALLLLVSSPLSMMTIHAEENEIEGESITSTDENNDEATEEQEDDNTVLISDTDEDGSPEFPGTSASEETQDTTAQKEELENDTENTTPGVEENLEIPEETLEKVPNTVDETEEPEDSENTKGDMTFHAESETYEVNVVLPYAALPKDTTLTVSELSPSSQEYEEAKGKVIADSDEIDTVEEFDENYGFAVLDISFTL